jgi:peptidyl-prolyl cis-trans isomerase C
MVNMDPQISLDLANAYSVNGLYQAAVNEYLFYLNTYEVESGRQANTYYLIANLYFERLHDYEKALEYYLKIKHYYPESPLQSEIGKQIVSCLERLQRTTEAIQAMEKEASLDKKAVTENRPGEVLAEIGAKQITQGDLDFQLSKLPPYMQKQFNNKEAKIKLLQQLVAEDLLYESAKRRGLEKDKEVIEAAFQAQKAFMVQKLLQDELKDKIKIDENDVELYYMAHKDNYSERDDKGNVTRQKAFNEVQQQAAQDLFQDRQQRETQKLVEQYMVSEKVKIHENRIR